MDEQEESKLVKRARKGDQQAYQRLVNQYMKIAGSVAYSIIDDFHTAADIVQESFVKVFQMLATLSDPNQFKSYLIRTVKTTAIDQLRRQRSVSYPKPMDFSDLTEEPLSFSDLRESSRPYTSLETKENIAKVHSFIEQLPTHYREVILLRYIGNLSYEDIATFLNMTAAAVESKLYQVRKILRRRIEEEL